jgi:hypothetical protein
MRLTPARTSRFNPVEGWFDNLSNGTARQSAHHPWDSYSLFLWTIDWAPRRTRVLFSRLIQPVIINPDQLPNERVDMKTEKKDYAKPQARSTSFGAVLSSIT